MIPTRSGLTNLHQSEKPLLWEALDAYFVCRKVQPRIGLYVAMRVEAATPTQDEP